MLSLRILCLTILGFSAWDFPRKFGPPGQKVVNHTLFALGRYFQSHPVAHRGEVRPQGCFKPVFAG